MKHRPLGMKFVIKCDMEVILAGRQTTVTIKIL